VQEELTRIISGKKVFFHPDLLVQFFALDHFKKLLTSSFKGVELYCSLSPPYGESLFPEKPEAIKLAKIGFGLLWK